VNDAAGRARDSVLSDPIFGGGYGRNDLHAS
jgi:hypothetical protein